MVVPPDYGADAPEELEDNSASEGSVLVIEVVALCLQVKLLEVQGAC